jgi:hypothetical protein
MAPLELAGTSLMEALGCAAVCLQLWHCVPDENCVLDNLLSIYEVGLSLLDVFHVAVLCGALPPLPSNLCKVFNRLWLALYFGGISAIKYSKQGGAIGKIFYLLGLAGYLWLAGVRIRVAFSCARTLSIRGFLFAVSGVWLLYFPLLLFYRLEHNSQDTWRPMEVEGK